MGLFSGKPKAGGGEYRGGCSSHDMRGPKRDTFKKANKDVIEHNKRIHGGKNEGGYVE